MKERKRGRPTNRKDGRAYTGTERVQRWRLRHTKKRFKSISNSDDEIMLGIMQLHNDDNPFDVDASYSGGGFYRSGRVPIPGLTFDINPQVNGVRRADVSKALPLEDASVRSIVFDPPFMCNGKRNNCPAGVRYGIFATWSDLERTYKGALLEFRRVLVPKGIVAWKCQDFTDAKTIMIHCLLYNWATATGFYTKDILIRYRNREHAGAVYRMHQTQRHARKFHSYWFVFEKSK